MSELKKVWQQIEHYLKEGISVVPVADRSMTFNGKPYEAKQALVKWTDFQKRIIKKEELWSVMDDAFTTAVAIVCGAISGNMETLDIDVKYSPGIDAILFQDLKLLYPDLFEKLRIHKTPTGGFHIPYRVTGGEVPGNRKLASRPATEHELSLKPKEKVKAFLETRGEGGYILAPPSMGYQVVKDAPIPVLTWEERCSLIALCESYNQVIKVEKPYKASRVEESYYDENPFEDYNNRVDPAALIEEFGWKQYKHNSRFIWFTRPGKEKSVSASFNFEKRVYFIFTSSTELEPSTGYKPATLLAALRYGGDKKRTYAWLVEQGYGKVKPHVEKRTVKLTALKGGKLPANFSQGARVQLEEEVTHLHQQYPYGVFWEEDEDGVIRISRERIYHIAEAMGFYLYDEEPVLVEAHTVRRVGKRSVYDALRAYVKEENESYREKILNAYEAFLQNAGKFTIERLPMLEPHRFVQDDRHCCFKFYQNGWLAISSDGYELHPYDTIHGLVWVDQVQPRDFQQGQGGLYKDFLDRALDFERYREHVMKVVGWLSHHYKDETTGYIIALTEACPDPKQGGGSGKNLFCNLFRNTTTYTSINGAQVKKYDDAFLQAWNGERLFCISDPKKDFDWSFLKEFATGVGTLEKKYQNKKVLSVKELPKMLVATNFSYEISDGGLKRRIIHLEFTDFFTKMGGVDRFYGKHFTDDWTAEDWAGYDTLIAQSVQKWIAGGRKLANVELTEGGWTKQFDQQYGALTREFIEEHWGWWTRDGFVANEKFKEAYDRFCNDANIQHHWRLSAIKMNMALQAWCDHKGVLFTKDAQKKNEMHVNVKGRLFETETPF